MNTNRISRIFQLLTILQSQKRCKIPELAAILGISQRTIFRDLNALKEANISCNFNRMKHYYALDSKSSFPIFALSKEEAFSLLLLLHKSRHYGRFPCSNVALTAALKIENSLTNKVRKFCNTSLRTISINHFPQTINGSLNDIFVKLLEAIIKRQFLNIHYHLPYEQRTIIIDFKPYHLIYAERAWHIIGESGIHKEAHTLKLSRIQQLTLLDKYFEEDKHFCLREHFGYAWSLLREGQIYQVELKFSPEIAAEVAEVQWHETQNVSFEMDGSAILRFRVDGINEITWWILGYGNRVEVLKPKILRQRIVQIAQRVVNSSKAAATD